MGLIQSTTIANNKGRGSRTYYSTTSLCNDMLYDKETTTSRNNDVETRPHHESVKSNNKLINDNKLKKDITTINSNKLINDNKLKKDITTINSSNIQNLENPKTLFNNTSKKQPKKNLYINCIDLINNFTEDEYLRELLEKFLRICIQNSNDGNYPLAPNIFKGKLNKLAKYAKTIDEQVETVQYSIDNGYSGIYELKKNQKSNKSMGCDKNGIFQDNTEPDRRDHSREEFRVVDEGF